MQHWRILLFEEEEWSFDFFPLVKWNFKVADGGGAENFIQFNPSYWRDVFDWLLAKKKMSTTIVIVYR